MKLNDNIELLHGDCLELMKDIPDKSIDMILCDLPYQVTGMKWDKIIPFKEMWTLYERIIRDDGAIVLFATNPFSSALVMSNPKLFRYEWIWDKTRGSNFQQANYAPMKSHEQILVFSKKPAIYTKNGSMRYYPQKVGDEEYVSKMGNSGNIVRNKGNNSLKRVERVLKGKHPKTIQTFKKDSKLHPTAKPVALLELLIKSYTNENELILDNCMGSGSTGIAAINTNRKFIGIEKDDKYFKIARNRIEECLNEKYI